MKMNGSKASLLGGLLLLCSLPAYAQITSAPLPAVLVPPPSAPAALAIPSSTPPAPVASTNTAAAAAGVDPGTPSAAPAETPSAPVASTPAVTAPDATAATDPNATPAAAAPTVKPKPKRVAVAAAPRESALSTDPQPTFGPDTIYSTDEAIGRYGAIVQAGGWPTIPEAMRPGAKGDGVTLLRHRLAIEGDLDAAHEGDAPYNAVWDEDVTRAVKHFQMRMGLAQNGIVAGETLKAMNVSADERWRELSASAQRLGNQTFSFGPRYVVVNIPATQVEAIENGKVVHHYIAIVGDVKHQSPTIAAQVQSINLNPTWTLPNSIIKNEIIPHMRKDPNYLSREKIRILDGHGTEIDPRSINWDTDKAANYILRQDSGAANSLGLIRINMPNSEAVYMHDTPAKGLFGADYRFLSHGCVRVDGVWDLAVWLLDETSGAPNGAWDKPDLLNETALGQHTEIKLAKSVPVIWVYLTGWATPDGTVHFRDDIYNVDAPRSNEVAKAGAI